ncbi:MAG: hypothetical protein P8K74_06030 [Flavobacteriaceae bacterium]|nr:hypothetical protein [Flavobacteriaceae bacterium]MDG2235778.1 hypothetical protein [Flavobacteriaceae bacterium]
MKKIIALLLLFHICLGMLAPSLNLIFSNSFENNIVYISLEAESEADEKEIESEEKILSYFQSLELSNITKISCHIFSNQNLYASFYQKFFSPPPEV